MRPATFLISAGTAAVAIMAAPTAGATAAVGIIILASVAVMAELAS